MELSTAENHVGAAPPMWQRKGTEKAGTAIEAQCEPIKLIQFMRFIPAVTKK